MIELRENWKEGQGGQKRGEKAHSIGYACLLSLLGKANHRFGPHGIQDTFSTLELIEKRPSTKGWTSRDFSKLKAVYGAAAVELNRA